METPLLQQRTDELRVGAVLKLRRYFFPPSFMHLIKYVLVLKLGEALCYKIKR